MARTTSPNLAVPDTPATKVSGRPLAVGLIVSLRPGQWTKNLILFAALIFGGKLFDWRAVVLSSEAFVIFCALSGVVYLVNDIADRESCLSRPPAPPPRSSARWHWAPPSRSGVTSAWRPAPTCC
jgi:hypothetical protein